MTFVQIDFAPSEAATLRHRMEVPDAMADVFDPYRGSGNKWGLTDHDEITDRVCSILDEIVTERSKGAMTINIDLANVDQVEVLTEVVEGSVLSLMAADMSDCCLGCSEYRQGKAILAAISRVEAKLEEAGLPLCFP